MQNWWVVVIVTIAFVAVMTLFIKCCAVHTPSTNPNKPPPYNIYETLRHPSTLIRRPRGRSRDNRHAERAGEPREERRRRRRRGGLRFGAHLLISSKLKCSKCAINGCNNSRGNTRRRPINIGGGANSAARRSTAALLGRRSSIGRWR